MTGVMFDPETRTMPMPPRPGAVAMATMGSESEFMPVAIFTRAEDMRRPFR